MVLDHVPVAVAVLGSDGEPLYQNRSTTRLLGGRQLMADDLPLAGAHGCDGPPLTVELHGNGEPRPVEASLAPVDVAGDPGTVAVVLVDVTERRRTEALLADAHADLVRKAAALQRSNAELETFAYVASHDLGEPLRVISGYVDLLARRYRGRLDDDADEFIGFAVEGCARMRQLIDDVLNYSRVAWSEPELGQVDTGAVVASAVRRLRAQIDEAQADVTIGRLPPVSGDADRLTALFQNLIGNAVKFARHDVPPHVEVSAQRHGPSEWLFTVSDNGIGIEPELRERAFAMFRRLHPRASYSGTGIGLALCRTVVERHGGRIWIDGDPANGTKVHFTLTDWDTR